MFQKNNMKRGIIGDNKAQVLSLDVLLALIIVTITIGMSANAMDITSFKIADYSAGKSLDRITTDAAEILISTPGSPDWEKTNNSLLVNPGLAIDNNEGKASINVLSIKKISQLRIRYLELMNSRMVPNGGSSSLIIYPSNPSLEILEVHDEIPPTNASEVAVANRTVLVDFSMDFKILVNLNPYHNSSLQNSSERYQLICPHYNVTGIKTHEKPNFNTKKPGWTCSNFKVSQQDLNSTDFYILSDPSCVEDASARWILDRSENISEQDEKFTSNPRIINDRVSKILGSDSEAVLWIHIFTSGDASKSFNVYLVGVPRGTPSDEVRVEYLNPQSYFLVLKMWV